VVKSFGGHYSRLPNALSDEGECGTVGEPSLGRRGSLGKGFPLVDIVDL